MFSKSSDLALALGMAVFVVGALYSVQELTGIRAVELFGIGLIVDWLYRWIRSWDK